MVRIASALIVLSVGLIYGAPVFALTEAECESPANKGTCRIGSCNDGEQEIGVCTDNLWEVTCCSKGVLPPGGSAQSSSGGTGVVSPAAPTSSGSGGAASPGSPITLSDPLKGIGLYGILNRLIISFLGVIGAVSLLVFVYAGVTYMTAGSSDRVKKATDAMKYAVLGIMIIMMAYIVTNFFFQALTTDPANANKTQKPVTLPQTPQ